MWSGLLFGGTVLRTVCLGPVSHTLLSEPGHQRHPSHRAYGRTRRTAFSGTPIALATRSNSARSIPVFALPVKVSSTKYPTEAMSANSDCGDSLVRPTTHEN